MERHGIAIDTGTIADFCRQNQIRRLALFGSYLTDDFRPDSDIDMLVEFEPEARVGLLGMARMEIELSDLLGRKVDLRTPEDFSRYFRDKVVASAEVVYAA
jgi:predicted nucleotidyltransferase